MAGSGPGKSFRRTRSLPKTILLTVTRTRFTSASLAPHTYASNGRTDGGGRSNGNLFAMSSYERFDIGQGRRQELRRSARVALALAHPEHGTATLLRHPISSVRDTNTGNDPCWAPILTKGVCFIDL